jgi:hypothetical protein
MNTHEVCEWLSAREQAQQPALVNLWSVAKGGETRKDTQPQSLAAEAIVRIDNLVTLVKGQGPYKGANANKIWGALCGFTQDLALGEEAIQLQVDISKLLQANKDEHQSFGKDERPLQEGLVQLRESVSTFLTAGSDFSQQSADKPIYFPLSYLADPTQLLEAARLEEGDNTFRQFLRGLQLRIGNRLQDQRWSSFFSYDRLKLSDFRSWLKQLAP